MALRNDGKLPLDENLIILLAFVPYHLYNSFIHAALIPKILYSHLIKLAIPPFH
jgi:hypothetical protein